MLGRCQQLEIPSGGGYKPGTKMRSPVQRLPALATVCDASGISAFRGLGESRRSLPLWRTRTRVLVGRIGAWERRVSPRVWAAPSLRRAPHTQPRPTDIDEYRSGGASAASARLDLPRGLAASRPHHRELLQDRGNFFECGEALAQPSTAIPPLCEAKIAVLPIGESRKGDAGAVDRLVDRPIQ
jgi:hypothetical protein